MLLLAAGTAAGAEGASTATTPAANNSLEEIVVTGIRASIERSIAIKKESDSIVEVISAEDIGKLPDSSIAEAISRLPGLAGQRLDGRQSSVAIRGLGEDFTTATLNGREQVSIGDNRGVEFDVYPSEIMAGLTVYKTPDASLITQGIGGTIDMQTVKPLDVDSSFNVNFNYEKNDLGQLNPGSDDTGWRSTLSYIDQFAGDRLGVAVAVSTMNSPSQEERWNAWGYPTDAGSGALILGGAKPFVRSSKLERDTYMGVLEFSPSETLRITADALYIDFQDDKTLRGIEIPGAVWGGGPCATPPGTGPCYTVGAVNDGLVTQGVLHNRRGQIRNDFERRAAELTSFGANVKFDVSDTWSMTFDVSRSEVERDIWSLESYAGSGRSSDTTAATDDIGFTMAPGNEGIRFTPTLDYGDDTLFQLGGAQGWGNGTTVPNDAQDGFINFPHVEDTLTSARLSAGVELDIGFLKRLEFGLSYADREKQKQDNGTFLTLPEYPGVAAIPAQFRLPNTSLDFIGMGSMISYDSFGLWRSGYYQETSENLTTPGRLINSWTVEEKISIGYAKAGFNTDLGSIGITGNFGVQVVQTDQSSTGSAVTVENGFVQSQPTSGGDKFTDVLPSVNASFHLTDSQQIRFGAARTLSRSRMDRMNASYGFTFNAANNTPGATIDRSPWSGNGANPGLRPQEADQFDLTYENYFSNEGYFSIGGFYKDLKSWQVTTLEVVDFSNVTPPGGQVALFNQGLVGRWVNADGGLVRGLEFQTAIPAGLFVPALDGFGAIMTATYLESQIDYQGQQAPVPGLSKNIYNLTAYYEKHGFSARVSGSKRSAFFGEVYAISFTRQYVNVQESEIWDAQLSYDFSHSSIDRLRGLKVTLQVQNFTDEPFGTYNVGGDERLVRDFQTYGSNYLLGFSYTF